MKWPWLHIVITPLCFTLVLAQWNSAKGQTEPVLAKPVVKSVLKSASSASPLTEEAAVSRPAPETEAIPIPVPDPLLNSVHEPPRVEEVDESCCDEKIPDGVLAVVNGIRITRQEVEDKVRPMLAELGTSVAEARRKQLVLQINGKLLEQEARRRDTDTTTLLQEEVLSKVANPTRDEALAFYNENKAKFEAEFDTVAGKITERLLMLRQAEQAKKLADRLRSAGQVVVPVEPADIVALKADPARVLAVVGGEAITQHDVDRVLQPVLLQAERTTYQVTKDVLEDTIGTILIQHEAQRRKVTVESLVKSEITASVQPVTEQEILAFYTQNKARLDLDIGQPQSREMIVRHLTQFRARQARLAFVQQLRPTASVEVYLAEPAQPRYEISVDDQPVLGQTDAPITIVVFADFECPRCANLHETLQRLIHEYDQQVRLVARDFPLTEHPHSYLAAIAAEAAREQERYWDYAAVLYANQTALDVEHLKQYASELGLDRTRFDVALDSQKPSGKVYLDRRDGLQLGIRSTPIVFVNGQPLVDKSYQSLKIAIDDALAAPTESQAKSE